MSRLLVAVGGTGQHIALAFARLVRLGAISREGHELFVIDGDDNSELAKRLKTFGHTIGGDGTEVKDDDTVHPLKGATKIHPPFTRLAGKTVFEKLFIDENSPRGERELFEAFFDEDAAAKDLDKGMYGRPSVGATVFAKAGESEMAGLFAAAARTTDTVVFGSFVGGTGAGITHQLVKMIHDRSPNRRIFGVFLLPWLQLQSSAGSGQTVDVDDGVLDTNMRHGLEYFFQHTAENLNASALLGVPDQAAGWMERARPTGGQSDELPHFLHLVAVRSAMALPEMSVIDNVKGKVHAYGHPEASQRFLYDSEWHEGKSLLYRAHAAQFAHALLSYLTSAKTLDDIRASLGFFASKDRVSKPLALTIEGHVKLLKIDEATCVRRMADRWIVSRDQLADSTTWLTKILGPVATNTVVRQAQESPAEMLRKCWTEETKADRANPKNAEQLAVDLEAQLFRRFHVGV